MSGAGDAAGRDRGGGEEEELASSSEDNAAATAHARDVHVAAITFWGALKIPVNISDSTTMGVQAKCV